MSKLVGLSGVRVANPHQKDAVMLLPSLRQIDPAGRKGEGMDAGGQRRRCPQTSWVCDRGIGEGRGLTETVRLSGRDGSGGALDRYEPIILQIGRSDLVSVADSLQGPGARRAREGCELNASPLGFRTAIGLGTRAGAWPWRMRASEVWPRSRRFGWRQSDCSGRGMGCPAELHRDMGPPVCHIAKDERKGGE